MIDASAFTGPWIGETMGHISPSHVWEITLVGSVLHIQTQWEGEAARTPIYGLPMNDAPAFRIERKTAVMVDAQHFVIAGWDTNDTRGGKGPHFDVVFSRPGIAELGAKDAHRRYKATQKTGKA